MHHQIILAAFGIALASVTTLFAQPLIKSVDSSGNVTYSNKPVTDAVSTTEVQVAPPPPADQVEDAIQQGKSVVKEADQLTKERKALVKEREADAEADEEPADATPETVIEEGGRPVYNRWPNERPGIPIAPGPIPVQPIAPPPAAISPVARPMPSL